MGQRGGKRGRRGKLARPRRPPRESAPLTPLQVARESALLAANGGRGVTKQAIADRASALRGERITRQSVGRVMRDDFHSPEIVAAFCELTGTDAAAMFPDPADAATAAP